MCGNNFGNLITFDIKLAEKFVFVAIQGWLQVPEDRFENKETLIPKYIKSIIECGWVPSVKQVFYEETN